MINFVKKTIYTSETYRCKVINEPIISSLTKDKQVQLFVKREDLVHPFISGNKFRKLKYNLEAFYRQKANGIITFGGAYSNHIEAVSSAGKEFNIKTIGVIRGEELQDKPLNTTLSRAVSNGMELVFVPRSIYKEKERPEVLSQYISDYKDFLLVPEGGTNALAVRGCEEILQDKDACFNVVCSSVGTGGTLAGIVNSSSPTQHVIGFSALKGNFLEDMVGKWTSKSNWSINSDFHFGGYAKVSKELIDFINVFKEAYQIQLDPLYTGKMMFGIMEMIKNNRFKKNTSILAVHTGGLQAINGMNLELEKKGLPLINV